MSSLYIIRSYGIFVNRKGHCWFVERQKINIFWTCEPYGLWQISEDANHGLTHGHRSRGRPKKKWLDNIREDYEDLNMSIIQASHLTWNRKEWRNTVCNLSYTGARGLRHRRQGHNSSLPVCSSVRHTRALWQNKRTYCRYFDTAWKGNHSNFLLPTGVGGRYPILLEICA